MTTIFTLYNHKGGVSKTTTTFNLAHILADQGYRVLLVDADPQCNLTELALVNTIRELDKAAEENDEVNDLPGSSLIDLLKPRIDGDVPAIPADESVECVPSAPNLDIIRGSVDLNSIEDALSQAHDQRFSSKTHEKRTYVALGDFLRRLGKSRGYDFIMIDVGPSSGALTRYCFLSCDAFFIPVAPDRFNVQAVRTLSSIVDRWISEHRQVVESFRELELPVAPGRPVFLGTIVSSFKIVKGQPKPGYKLWMSRIPKTVEEDLLPVLRKHADGNDLLVSDSVEQDVTAAEVPDFSSLATVMQEVGKAVFSITQGDTKLITESGKPWGGATWTSGVERMKDYREKYEAIAKRVIDFRKSRSSK